MHAYILIYTYIDRHLLSTRQLCTLSVVGGVVAIGLEQSPRFECRTPHLAKFRDAVHHMTCWDIM